MIRIQGKGSKFVIDWKSKYIQNVSNYIGDSQTFRQEREDPSERHRVRVEQWADKWLERGEITQERSRLGQNSKF